MHQFKGTVNTEKRYEIILLVNLDYDNKHICEVTIQIDEPFLDFRTNCMTLSLANGAFFVVPHLLILTRNIDVLIYFQDREDKANRKTLNLMNYS